MIFGLLLFIAGITLMGLEFGWWNNADINRLWHYWPILLIIYGFSLIFKPKKLSWLFHVTIWLILLLGIIYLFVSPWTPIKSLKNHSATQSTITSEIPQGAIAAKIFINVGAINLDISGGALNLLQGDYTSNISSLGINDTFKNNIIETHIDMQRFRTFLFHNINNRLDLKLNNNLPISLEIKSGASNMDLDLAETTLKGLNIDFGASSMNLKIGTKIQNSAEIKIKGGATSIDIQIPRSIGTEIKTHTGLSSHNFSEFTKIENNVYRSNNYLATKNKIKITLDTGVPSINISQY